VLFFINIATRRVHIAGMTPNPNSAWMAQQARNMNSFFDELPERPTLLIRDHDSKFTAEFDAILKETSIRERLLVQGFEPLGGSVEDAPRFLQETSASAAN